MGGYRMDGCEMDGYGMNGCGLDGKMDTRWFTGDTPDAIQGGEGVKKATPHHTISNQIRREQTRRGRE
ncbi:hypothetical protein EmuJ_001090600 [Echinococcus multilocularis]|uniref:Uncharacterized protein n=1 Tax=Echinococcus multilocularis TaxID=6211 RepID=A0A068YIQ2_ECHMU|nr:hypothetical protein EmuJ_001090600 [Echinococcus multilocularis]